MHTRTRMLLVALAAALVLALAAGVAGANLALGVDNETTVSQSSRAVTFESSLASIICEMTMISTIARGFGKTNGEEVGRVRDVRPANCRGSGAVRRVRSFRILGLPGEGGHRAELWEILYTSFSGTLPNPTEYRLRLEQTQILLELETLFGTVNCLFEGAIEGRARVEGGALSALETLAEANTVPLHASVLNTGLCPEEGTLNASGAGAYRMTTTTRIVLVAGGRGTGLIIEENPLNIPMGQPESSTRLINNNSHFEVRIVSASGEEKYRPALESGCTADWIPAGGSCRITVRRNAGARGDGQVRVRSRWRLGEEDHTITVRAP